MVLKRFVSAIQRKLAAHTETTSYMKMNVIDGRKNYKATVEALNNLQSNANYIKNLRESKLTHEEKYANTTLQVQKYLKRSGLTLEDLDTLSVIHITGTKGKGSTCALCESILRHHGFRTGFFSSPHLLEVRERIRINGRPIEKQTFIEHFWKIYDKLEKNKSNPNDMPLYFRFLTVLAFHVFLAEKVDVAVIEVGIGGEYDCTNVIRKAPVVGITSLGIDHTSVLGKTIEEIAWNKAGIMKKHSKVFTVPQIESAMNVLKERSIEKNCSLEVAQLHTDLPVTKMPVSSIIANTNASLAIALAEAWINSQDKNTQSKGNFAYSEVTKQGITNCFWPGRYQVLRISDINYYLDGAHTIESIAICAEWFRENTKDDRRKKALIFNATGDRNSEELLNKLIKCNFDDVFFVPNKATSLNHPDITNFNITGDQQLERCYHHHKIWLKLKENHYCTKTGVVLVQPSVSHALINLKKCDKYDVLITGSVHLVGSSLTILDPELKGS